MTSDLHEILYCSLLAPDQPPEVVGQIIGQARSQNQRSGITGLLVFDGQRFCQHLEGDEAAVKDLLARLEQDPRHGAVHILFEGTLVERRYPRFEMGFASVEDGDDIAEIENLRGQAALERFLALRSRFDISG